MARMEVLQDDEHYRVERTVWRGREAVRKTVQETLSTERKQAFHNEIMGMQLYRSMALKHPEWRLSVPEVFEEGSDFVLREYVDGEELLAFTATRSQASPRLTRLAEALAGIDTIEPDQSYTPDRDSAPYTDIRRRFAAWSEAPLKTRMLSAENFSAANALIEEFQPRLQPRYAHGDMSPFTHVYLLPNDTLGLIDFEHFSPQKARYYDVAYAYSRIFTRSNDPSIAGDFLRHFLEVSEPAPYKTEQLLAIMSQRAIGMHFDAHNDKLRGVDYVGRARLLLKLCLSRDLGRLVDIRDVDNA